MWQFKYKLLGKLIRARDKASRFRKSVAEVEASGQRASFLDATDLTLREGRVAQRKNDLLDTATRLYDCYRKSGDAHVLKHLRTIYDQMTTVGHEQRHLSRMRDVVVRSQTARDAEVMSLFVEREILCSNDRQKIRNWTRPSLKSVSRRAAQLEVERDMERDVHQEYMTLQSESVGESEEEECQSDSRFVDWLETLGGRDIACASRQVKDDGVGADMERLRSRMQQINNKDM